MLYKKIKNILKENNYNFINLQSTLSTMDEVRDFLIKKNKNCLLLASEQTQGRGRRGSLWSSPLGNIYCSMSFSNLVKVKDHFMFSVIICVSIKMALEKYYVKGIQFKWPNDIFYENKKFSGIISEIYNINNSKQYIVMGFGINFISSPKVKNYPTTHIKSFCANIEINDFLLSFLEILFTNYKNFMKGNNIHILNIYTNSLMYINKNIKIMLPNNSIKSSIFRGINLDGSLRLENKKNIENIYNGSIEI